MENIPESRETTEETQSIIALSLVPGIGSARSRELVSHFGSAIKVFEASHAELSRIGGVGKKLAKAILSFDDMAKVKYQIECAKQVGAYLVTYWSCEYPELLRTIYDPPAFLWVRGNLPDLKKICVAVVGTRKPSLYGKKVTSHFTHQLVEHNFAVVSGLAYGVDSVAHQSAIDAGGVTIAVLGSGVDRIYPSANKKLAQRILDRGAIISEYPMQTKPDATNFPRRNRIISGLAKGTLVTEAYERGGALITARIAVEQNRDVFAVPGSVFNDSALGTHQLIQLGCGKLVHSAKDILEEWHDVPRTTGSSGNSEGQVGKMNTIEKALYEILTEDPININQICDKSGLDPSTVLVYLLNLEFKGLIFQLAGKQFYKA